MTRKVLAWWFSDESRKLGYGDGRSVCKGTTHKVDCDPVLCESGLHGSRNILRALEHTQGPVIWRVQLSGTIVEGDDKLTATSRKYLWGYDASDVLRAFARKCALDVIHLWDAPEVVRTYLETGDNSLRDAVWTIARHTAWNAQIAPIWAAARATAAASSVGAAYAARDAAINATRPATWAGAGAGAWESQSKRLLAMVRKGRT